MAATKTAHLHTVGIDRIEVAHEYPTALMRSHGTDTDFLPDLSQRMIGAPQAARDPRRRNLERVPAGNGLVHVEQVTNLTTDTRQFVQINGAPTRLVQEQPQHHSAAFSTKFHIHD